MRQLYILLFILTVFSISAQPVSTYPELPYTSFNVVEMEGDVVVALGSCDQVWVSRDGGDSWDYSIVEGIGSYDIKLLPGANSAIIAQFRGLKILDFDQGVINEFENEAVFNDNVNRQVEVIGDDVYVFNPEGIFKSQAGTFEWENVWQDTSENDIVHVTNVTDNYIFMGMRYGRLLKYELATGEVEHLSDFGKWIKEIEMVNDDMGYLLTDANTMILKTEDGGSTFTALDGMPEKIRPRAYGEDVLISVNTNRIYLSMDGGATSEYIQTANTPEFGLSYGGTFTQDGTLYLWGQGSTLAKSTDFGQSFTFLSPYNKNDFNGVEIAASGQGYAVGTFGQVVTTDDHGHTWQPTLQGVIQDEYLNDVVMLDNGSIIIVGSEGIHKVTNGSVQTADDITYGDYIYKDPAGEFLIAAAYNESNNLYRSTDDGSSWTEVLSGIGYAKNITQSIDGSLYAKAEDQGFYKSEDGGLTWTMVDLGIDAREVRWVSDDVVLAIVNGAISKSTDGGQLWNTIATGYASDNLRIIAEEHYIYTSRQNDQTNLFETLDGGESWHLQYQNCTPTQDIKLNSLGEAVVVQQTGHINLVALTTVTSSNDIETEVSSTLFPNPTLGQGYISATDKWQSLEIIDIRGVSHLNLRRYQEAIPVGELAAGMYIVRLKANGKESVEKLIIQ